MKNPLLCVVFLRNLYFFLQWYLWRDSPIYLNPFKQTHWRRRGVVCCWFSLLPLPPVPQVMTALLFANEATFPPSSFIFYFQLLTGMSSSSFNFFSTWTTPKHPLYSGIPVHLCCPKKMYFHLAVFLQKAVQWRSVESKNWLAWQKEISLVSKHWLRIGSKLSGFDNRGECAFECVCSAVYSSVFVLGELEGWACTYLCL